MEFHLLDLGDGQPIVPPPPPPQQDMFAHLLQADAAPFVPAQPQPQPQLQQVPPQPVPQAASSAFFSPPLPRVSMKAAKIKLNDFWVDSPAAWFGMAEAQFHLRGITGELDRFCIVVAAMSREVARPVGHLIAQPDLFTPYSTLKAALLASHQLTPYQKMERLMAMPAMGDRTPSQLLHDILEFCPNSAAAGQEFFAFAFLHRLPRELRVLLAHEDHQDMRQLAALADQKHSYHARASHDTIAAVAVQEDPAVAAAVNGRQKQHQQPKKDKQQGLKKPLSPAETAAAKAARKSRPTNVAQAASGLCHYHWTWGADAHKCEAPCTWQGN
jgi:hypothetical protein